MCQGEPLPCSSDTNSVALAIFEESGAEPDTPHRHTTYLPSKVPPLHTLNPFASVKTTPPLFTHCACVTGSPLA
jgi:hypothetical protein